MQRREVYHVVPDRDRGWRVNHEGSTAPVDRSDTKEAALELAKQRAKKAALGQVIVHRQDGSIEEEFTYGEDPRRTPG